MQKIMFLDTETTGLDEKDKDGLTLLAHEIHSIIELSGIVDIGGSIVDRFKLLAAPKKGDTPQAEALTANGKTLEDISKYGPQRELFDSFKEILGKHVDPYDKKDKIWFVAYNARFDYEFCRQLFTDHQDGFFGSWFWFPYIDIMQMAGFIMMTTETRSLVPNMKLSTLAKSLGIEVKDSSFHDGLYDARIVRQIFYKIVSET